MVAEFLDPVRALRFGIPQAERPNTANVESNCIFMGLTFDRLQQVAAVSRLCRSRIHADDTMQFGDLALRKYDRCLQNKLVYIFGAGWFGERSTVSKVLRSARQQIACVDQCANIRRFCMGSRRQTVPNFMGRQIIVVCGNENAAHCELAAFVAVYEIYIHRKAAPRDAMFAGRMKMELLQVVALVAKGDVAAFAVIFLNRMVIIDQIHQRHFVMDVEWCEVTGFCRFEVNRRLMLAGRACLERGFKVAPMRRSTGTAITANWRLGFSLAFAAPQRFF